MTKDKLTRAVEEAKTETRNALQTVYDALNQGQQKKIIKNESVKSLFDLYGVNYAEKEI
jgi:Fe2+ or Zn2+ uptake regulation protein